MDDIEQFKEVIREYVAQSTRRNRKIVAEELISIWERLRTQGVEAYDFAHMALMVAECAMTYHDSIEENLRFGKFLKEAGERKIRAVSTHWPPVDPAEWPEGWPKDKFE